LYFWEVKCFLANIWQFQQNALFYVDF
jgi:hypothetical protein